MVGLDGDRCSQPCQMATVFEPVNSFKTNQIKLARLQRQLSKRSSSAATGRNKSQDPAAAFTYRQYPPRLPSQGHNDYQQNHAMIVIEDLKVASMSKSAVGTTSQPGRNVRAKSGLNRSILDQAGLSCAASSNISRHGEAVRCWR